MEFLGKNQEEQIKGFEKKLGALNVTAKSWNQMLKVIDTKQDRMEQLMGEMKRKNELIISILTKMVEAQSAHTPDSVTEIFGEGCNVQGQGSEGHPTATGVSKVIKNSVILEDFKQDIVSVNLDIEVPASDDNLSQYAQSLPKYTENTRLPKDDFPHFGGEGPSEWLRKASEYFRIHQVSEELRLGIAKMHLEGRAYVWFYGFNASHPNVDWGMFSEELCKRFDENFEIIEEEGESKEELEEESIVPPSDTTSEVVSVEFTNGLWSDSGEREHKLNEVGQPELGQEHMHLHSVNLPGVGNPEVIIEDFVLCCDVNSAETLDAENVKSKKQVKSNRKLLTENQVPIPSVVEKILVELEESARTGILVGHDNDLIDILVVADALKGEVVVVVEGLMKIGMNPIMVTEDSWRTAQAIVKEVGIAYVRAEVIPTVKIDVIHSVQKGGKSVGEREINALLIQPGDVFKVLPGSSLHILHYLLNPRVVKRMRQLLTTSKEDLQTFNLEDKVNLRGRDVMAWALLDYLLGLYC